MRGNETRRQNIHRQEIPKDPRYGVGASWAISEDVFGEFSESSDGKYVMLGPRPEPIRDSLAGIGLRRLLISP